MEKQKVQKLIIFLKYFVMKKKIIRKHCANIPLPVKIADKFVRNS